MEEFLLKKIENKPTTFKVETKRVDKSYVLDSLGYSRNLGGFILQNFSEWTVDVKNPKTKIFIEIKKDEFILNWRKHKAAGGFPVGINGRALMLLSGGLDSPVASRLLLKKGMKVDFLTFITPPHTSDKVIDKVKMLINKITIDSKLEKSRLYICNFTNIQHELAHISKTSYQITLMRRYFFRIAQSLAISQNYDAIATGESLGQVASQTINSINTISSVLSEKIVLRPLLCLDKSEIIKISKEIDTYDTSIIPFNDSCGLFVPQNPVTNPNKEIAEKLESELEFIDGVVEATIKNKIVINDV